jgi:C-terminal peptidase prc
MKKLLFIILATIIFVPASHAFRDVTKGSDFETQVQSLIDRGLLQDGTFLRPNYSIPASMFWEIVLLDAGFDPQSATFGTPLPPNVEASDPLAQFLREAIRRKFISATVPFEPNATIERIDAIRVLTKTKGLLTPRTTSKLFLRKLSGAPAGQPYLSSVEAAYASKMLADKDISPLKPNALLTRRDLIGWIYNYSVRGEKKSTINPGSARTRRAQTPARQVTPRTQTQTRGRTYSRPKSQKRTIEIQAVSSPSRTKASSGLRIPNGTIFENIFKKITTQYRFPEQLTDEKQKEMIDAAIAAMVTKLGDKYTSYIEPAKTKMFQAGLEGQFEGIGAYVEMVNEKFMITAPITGSPAEKAGVMAGDVVIEVDGKTIEGESITETINRIKGPAGTNVTLTILRDTNFQTITVTRGKITVPSITLKWNKSVPIIGVHKFTSTTGKDFQKILTEEVLPKQPRGLVFDLRNNPGGYLTSAVAMGEFLLDKGDLVFSVEYKGNTEEYRSSRRGELFGFENMVVLQNKGSASASEIFSGMVRDYGIAKIVGTKSHGKGTVQQVDRQSNGGTLKLTVAKWLTPKGLWIQEGAEETHGVPADVEVTDPTMEEKMAKVDRQLDTAVNEILRN